MSEAGKMSKTNFIKEFREDHRKVRDSLIEIGNALEKPDVAKARQILGKLDTLVGPHFRFEEEDLYPTLRQFLGEYVDQLLIEHDDVIKKAKTLADLLSRDRISKKEGLETKKAARSLLVHVSNCDGLALLSERLSDEELGKLSQKFLATREARVPLLKWAEKIRKK